MGQGRTIRLRAEIDVEVLVDAQAAVLCVNINLQATRKYLNLM